MLNEKNVVSANVDPKEDWDQFTKYLKADGFVSVNGKLYVLDLDKNKEADAGTELKSVSAQIANKAVERSGVPRDENGVITQDGTYLVINIDGTTLKGDKNPHGYMFKSPDDIVAALKDVGTIVESLIRKTSLSSVVSRILEGEDVREVLKNSIV